MTHLILIKVDTKDHKRMKEIYRNCKHSFPCSLSYFYQVAVSQYLERTSELGKFIEDLFKEDTDGR